MSNQVSDPAMDFALRGIVFPPQPHLIGQIMLETAKPDPDIKAIAHLISGDVTLASSLLKMVNSPYYGLPRKVTSVEESIILVGIRRTLSMATALSLSRSFKPVLGLESFWEDTARIAAFALMLANDLALNGDLSFLMGLFHDSGILLMMQQHKDYMDIYHQGTESVELSLADLESLHYQTDHARVGSVFARYWYLPETIVKAIQNHHNTAAFIELSDHEVGNLIAVNLMAEDINATVSCRANLNWMRMGNAALEHMMIDAEGWQALRMDVIARFGAGN